MEQESQIQGDYMTFKCSECGLTVDEIPEFKEKECPNDIQHYFRKKWETL